MTSILAAASTPRPVSVSFSPPVSPPRIRPPPVRPRSVLVGGELKHIRPALDSAPSQMGGGRIRVSCPPSVLESTGQLLKGSSNLDFYPNITVAPVGPSTLATVARRAGTSVTANFADASRPRHTGKRNRLFLLRRQVRLQGYAFP